jgi:hypothetical protein
MVARQVAREICTRPMRAGAVLVVMVMAMAGCGAAPVRPGLAPPAPDAVTARRALGPLVGDGVGAAEQRRLTRLIAVERRLGNRDQAVHAASLALEKARVDAATAGDDERAAAAERLAAARRQAIDVGRSLDAPLLVVAATVDAAPGTREADLLAGAVRHLTWIDDQQRQAIVRLGRDDPALLAQLERTSHGPPLATLDQLAGLGATAADRIATRLEQAVADHDLAAMARAAEVLLAADPLSMSGRLARQYLADREAGRLPDDAVVLQDVLMATPDPAGFSRLERLRRSHPESPALVAALAYRYLGSDLAGDAHALLRSLESADWIDGEARGLLDSLRALTLLEAGDLAGYRAWAEAAGAAGSAHATAIEASYWNREAPALRLAARQALRNGRRHGFPGYSVTASQRARLVALDDTAPAAERRAALAELRASAGWNEAVVAESCLREELSRPSCDARIDALDRIQAGAGTPEELGADLLRLTAVDGFGAEWLWIAARVRGAEVAALRPGVERLATSRVALTEPYVYARVMTALAAGDVEAAAAHLDDGAALLTQDSRLGLALGVADARDGISGTEIVDHLYMPLWPPAPLEAVAPDDEAPAELEVEVPGTGRVARMGRALSAWRRGWARSAHGELASLLVEADLRAHPTLAGLTALAALAAGDREAAGQAAAILEDTAPGSPTHALVAAELAAADGRFADALPRYRQAMQAWPATSLPASGYLRALAVVHPGKQGARAAREVILASPAPSVSWLRPLYTDGTIEDGATLARYLEAQGDGEVAARLDPRAATLQPIAQAAAAWFDRAIVSAPNPGDAVTIARRAAEFLRRADPPAGERARVAWLYFLAGEGWAARTVATAEDYDHTEPLGSWEWLVYLAGDRIGQAPAIDDALALTLWRFARHGDGDPAELAETLIGRRDRLAGADRVACRLLIDEGLADRAVEPCARAWRDLDQGLDADLAAGITWLLLERGDEVRRAGLAAEDVFTRARLEVSPTESEVWAANEAVYWERKSEWQRATEAWQRAVERGHVPEAGDPDPAALAELVHRGPLMRHAAARQWTDDQAWPRLIDQARLALFEGNLAAAGWYLTAAAARPVEVTEDTVAMWRSWVESAYELATDEVAAGRVDGAGVRRWMLDSQSLSPGLAREYAAAYPGAALARAMVLVSLEDQPPDQATLALARELAAGYPRNPIVVASAANILIHAREIDEARALLAVARAAHPNDAVLGMVLVPGGEPDWLDDAQRFEARMAETSPDPATARRVVADDRGYEVFVPDGGYFDGADYMAGDDFRVIIRPIDDADCPGPLCMTRVITGVEQGGFAMRWRLDRERDHTALLEARGVYLLVDLLESRGQTYLLGFSGSADGLAGRAAAIALARRTLRPLDRVLPASGAEALRLQLGSLPGAPVRAAGRLELDAYTGDGCPVAATVKQAGDDDARTALLVDLMLGEPERIAELLRCRPEGSANAGALALAAGLSGDPAGLTAARTLAAAHPDPLAAAARTALADAPVTDAPRYGWLQVLELLPPAQARALWDELFRSTDDRHKYAAIAASVMAPERADLELLRGEIRSGPSTWATAAAGAASMRGPNDADIAAIRARLDQLAAPLDDADIDILRHLSSLVAMQLDPADRVRLQRMRRLASKAGDQAARLERHLEVVLEAHALGQGQVAPASEDARRLLDHWRDRTAVPVPTGEPVASALLATATLPELLSGTDWSYVRYGIAGPMFEELREVVERDGGEVLDDDPRSPFHGLTDDILLPGGGLDLNRPIECAVRGAADDVFVCSAYVRDADAARAALDERDWGDDIGLAFPLRAAGTAGDALGRVAGLLPPEDGIYGYLDRGDLLVNERAWRIVDLGGHRIEQHYITEYSPGGMIVDTERYLFVGDRLYVFSSQELAHELLFDAPARPASLAADPLVQQILTRPPGEHAEGRLLDAAPAGIAGPVPVAFTMSAQGMTYHVGADTPALIAMRARLPHARILISSTVPWPESTALSDEPGAPPRWLAGGTFALARRPTGTWVAVVPLDERVRKALRADGLSPGAEPVTEGRRTYARTGDWLVVGSNEELVRQVLR